MKVFQLNDAEYWAGPDIESVTYAYKLLTGLNDDEAFENPHEIPDDQLDCLFLYSDADAQQITFRAELERINSLGINEPVFFTTTEW